jgi:hypothetical protein
MTGQGEVGRLVAVQNLSVGEDGRRIRPARHRYPVHVFAMRKYGVREGPSGESIVDVLGRPYDLLAQPRTTELGWPSEPWHEDDLDRLPVQLQPGPHHLGVRDRGFGDDVALGRSRECEAKGVLPLPLPALRKDLLTVRLSIPCAAALAQEAIAWCAPVAPYVGRIAECLALPVVPVEPGTVVLRVPVVLRTHALSATCAVGVCHKPAVTVSSSHCHSLVGCWVDRHLYNISWLKCKV